VHSPAAPVQHVGVNHRGFDILMAQQFLNRADVIPIFQQMGRKRVAESVTTRTLAQAGFSGCLFDSPLQDGFMEVMSSLYSRAWGYAETRETRVRSCNHAL